MKKIASLFKRNYEGNRKVFNEAVEGSEWVLNGEGTATRKWDGMAIAVINGKPFKRYDAKAGRTPPCDFMPAQEAPDAATGHWPGWVPETGSDKRIEQGLTWGSKNLFGGEQVPNGTYEVCGPTIGTRHGPNPENLTETILVIHGKDILPDCPRKFDEIKEYLRNKAIEGIVWHHQDGRMVKIKKSDFEY